MVINGHLWLCIVLKRSVVSSWLWLVLDCFDLCCHPLTNWKRSSIRNQVLDKCDRFTWTKNHGTGPSLRYVDGCPSQARPITATATRDAPSYADSSWAMNWADLNTVLNDNIRNLRPTGAMLVSCILFTMKPRTQWFGVWPLESIGTCSERLARQY